MTASVSRSLIISGSIDVDPERRDEALQAGLRFMQQTRQREGCLAYTWSPDLAVPGRIWVYERWRDQAALARHLASEPYLEMRNTIAAHGLKGFDVAKHRVDKSEPVYDPKGQPRADFFTENG